MLSTCSPDLSRKSEPVSEQRAGAPPQVQEPGAGCQSWGGGVGGCTPGSGDPHTLLC